MVQPNVNLDVLGPTPDGEESHGGCGSCGSGEKCGNGLEKVYPTTAVRFGYMRYIGEFTHAPDMKFTCGAKVVIQTRRGLEMGEQVSLTCSGCDKSVTRDQMKSWVDSCGSDSYVFDAGRIIREATAADLAEYAHIQGDNHNRRLFGQQVAKRHKLPMKVVECEAPFGGERLIFYFTSEERVDFRDVVKDLATEYRTRIEMRQIGARDEARLLADYETCGREVCCKVFLKTLRPISMRMAKLQKATLDPSQVSGRCGRLKCCLRYEHESYEELDKKLPRTGVRIRTAHGEGVIVNRQILTQLVQIRTDQDVLVTVVAEDILEVGVAGLTKRPTPPSDGPTRTDNRSRGTPKPRPWANKEPSAKPAAETPEVLPSPPAEEPIAEGPVGSSDQAGMDADKSPDSDRSRRGRRRGRRGGQGGPRRNGGDSEPPVEPAGPTE